jgi:methylated-DNA-[protein]-cysteine S-methyltransferase
MCYSHRKSLTVGIMVNQFQSLRGQQANPAGGSAFVDTALGVLRLSWSEAGLTRLMLPGGLLQTAHSAMRRDGSNDRDEEPAPAFVSDAMAALEAYAMGARVDFSAVPVDLVGADAFQTAIYAAARKLGYGQTMTYGELAEAAGHPGSARPTGAALGRNPVAIIIPCHRITAADGRLGGFSAPGGASTKQRLLSLERAAPVAAKGSQGSFAF